MNLLPESVETSLPSLINGSESPGSVGWELGRVSVAEVNLRRKLVSDFAEPLRWGARRDSRLPSLLLT